MNKVSIKRVGIFSGSFDPVHDGHIAFAEAAIKQCKLDKVFFLVEPRPRRKQGVKALEHRSAMVRIALKHHPHLGSILLHQSRFTVQDTMPVLQARFKGAELFMLLGDDFFTHLSSWPQLDDLVNSVRFIVGTRSHSRSEIDRHVRNIEKTKGLSFNFHLITTPVSSQSSRAIRQQFKKNQPVTGLAPDVQRYILRHQLYASKPKS